MKVTALAGGVGGAKLVEGLVNCLSPEDLTVIVNTGDDFDLFNLRICPDLDTICYTLAGISNNETGWGVDEESHNALNIISRLGGPNWFQLGDKDLGTHLERTRRLHEGESLSQIVQHFCNRWGIKSRILPMSDDPVSTIVSTMDNGDLPFQDYFVKNKCLPVIRKIRFEGAETAIPSQGVLASIEQSDLIVICPSNPFVSIDPILSIRGILSSVQQKPIIAVSPIIQGKALKGPAAKMFFELGVEPSVIAVAEHYREIITGLVIDNGDEIFSAEISTINIMPFITKTIMLTTKDRINLAQDVLNFGMRIIH